MEFLHDQDNQSVERVSSSDIISGKRLVTADVTMAEDGISVLGHVNPEPIVPIFNQDSIVTTGAEICLDSIPTEPCDYCKSQVSAHIVSSTPVAPTLTILSSTVLHLQRLKL